MAIKKIVFEPLSTTNITYTAIGGIRFYDNDGNEIDVIGSGVITDDLLTFESQIIIATATDTFNYNNSYNVGGAFRNDKKITGGSYTNNDYWLSANDNQTLTVTFKTPLEIGISKISYNPTPDAGYTNRGVDQTFYIKAYDDTDTLIHEYTVTPDVSVNDTVYYVETPELLSGTFLLFKDSNDEVYYLDSNGAFQDLGKTVTDLTANDFRNYGKNEVVDISPDDLDGKIIIAYPASGTAIRQCTMYYQPKSQFFKTVNPISLNMFSSLTSLSLTGAGDIKILIYNGIDWAYYDTTNTQFVTTTEPTTTDYTPFDNGNTIDEINAIPIDTLKTFLVNNEIGFAFLLTPADYSDIPSVSAITITGIPEVYQKYAANISRFESGMVITFNDDGDYKITYF